MSTADDRLADAIEALDLPGMRRALAAGAKLERKSIIPAIQRRPVRDDEDLVDVEALRLPSTDFIARSADGDAADAGAAANGDVPVPPVAAPTAAAAALEDEEAASAVRSMSAAGAAARGAAGDGSLTTNLSILRWAR